PGLELAEHVLGDLAAARASGVMGILADRPHVLAEVLGLRDRLKTPLRVALRGGAGGAEATDAGALPGLGGGRDQQRGEDERGEGTGHSDRLHGLGTENGKYRTRNGRMNTDGHG